MPSIIVICPLLLVPNNLLVIIVCPLVEQLDPSLIVLGTQSVYIAGHWRRLR